MEREQIERTDFPMTTPGYDPQEVYRHLCEIADAVERLREELGAAGAGPSTGGDGGGDAGAGADRRLEGARLVALNMALSGAPREEAAAALEESFTDLADRDALLDQVYAKASAAEQA